MTIRAVALFLLFLSGNNLLFSQQSGTISVRKTETFSKAVFDNDSYKLVALDRYGNPQDNAIISFVVSYAKKGKTESYRCSGSAIPAPVAKDLQKMKTATKIYFTEIKTQDADGHLQDLPDVIEFAFPACSNTSKK